MNDQVRSVLLGTAGLSALATIALVLTVSRAPRDAALPAWHRLRRTAAFAIAVHLVHFMEEWYAGFHVRFPEMLGLVAWPATMFALFNAAWIAVWIVCAALLPSGRRAIWFPLWFLALASAVNGVAHPLLSIAAGSYFPGLVTAPLAGIAGVVLWRALVRSSR